MESCCRNTGPCVHDEHLCTSSPLYSRDSGSSTSACHSAISSYESSPLCSSPLASSTGLSSMNRTIFSAISPL